MAIADAAAAGDGHFAALDAEDDTDDPRIPSS